MNRPVRTLVLIALSWVIALPGCGGPPSDAEQRLRSLTETEMFEADLDGLVESSRGFEPGCFDTESDPQTEGLAWRRFEPTGDAPSFESVMTELDAIAASQGWIRISQHTDELVSGAQWSSGDEGPTGEYITLYRVQGRYSIEAALGRGSFCGT